MHIDRGLGWGTQLSVLCTGCMIRCVLCCICVGLGFPCGGQCSGTQGSTGAQEMLFHQRVMRRKAADINLPERDTVGSDMVFIRVPWGWDVSSKRVFLISPKWRIDSRNVFVLEQTRNDLEPGMSFPVSWLLESSMFSLMTPGSPCPEPAAVLSLVFILLCHLEQHTGLLCLSDGFPWWHWAFYALSPSTPQLAPLSHPMGKVPYVVLFNRSIHLWRHLAPLCFSVKMH